MSKIGYSDFITDWEKMIDFCLLGVNEFLESYSYLDAEEWELTFSKVMEKLGIKLDKQNKAYISYVMDYWNTHDEDCYKDCFPVCFDEFCDNEWEYYMEETNGEVDFKEWLLNEYAEE